VIKSSVTPPFTATAHYMNVINSCNAQPFTAAAQYMNAMNSGGALHLPLLLTV
jgi:hypothetical protein